MLLIISATLGVSVIALGFGGAPNLTLDRHLLPTLLLPPPQATQQLRTPLGDFGGMGYTDAQIHKYTNRHVGAQNV